MIVCTADRHGNKQSLASLLALMIAPVTALGQAAPGYPPPREGISAAVATLNVDAGMLNDGAALFAERCSACHGTDGSGGGRLWSGLSEKPRILRDALGMATLSDRRLADVVRYGGFEMPAFADIRGERLIALIAYVRSLSVADLREIELQPLAQGAVASYRPVTDGVLQNPDPGDWLMYRRTYDAWGYSPLTSITKENVASLQLAWSIAMEPGEQETTPLVHDGVMYIVHPGDVIQALDATNGDLIWEYRRQKITNGKTRVRNIAIYDDKIFHITRGEPQLIAVNARTGELAWEVPLEGIFSSGPIVVDGKLISGRSCSPVDGPRTCYIAAYDAKNGNEIWRTATIARPDEPGGDSWGNLPYEERRHVGAWGVGSYDPLLKLIYWGTSVPAPSLERVRGTPGGDVLFSNSTLALDADSGAIVWYYQHLPRDNWDLDHVFERYLIDTLVAPDPDSVPWINRRAATGDVRKVVSGIPGKTGIVYTIDRESGQFLWARPTLNQNVVTDIDSDTGRVHVNEDLIVDAFEEVLVCPARSGGKNWPAGAYSPRTGLMYQPQQNLCMLHTGNTARATPEEVYASSVVFVEDPNVKGDPYPVGRVDAVSLSNGRTAWTHEQRAGMTSGLVATGGGLVFGGDVNRRFKALDDQTGKLLWETIVSGPVTGHPISYAAAGVQYIAVPVGGGTAEPERRVLSIHPEIKTSRGINALFVFALGPAISGTNSRTVD